LLMAENGGLKSLLSRMGERVYEDNEVVTDRE
jgi:hypothetical protein